MAQRDRDSQTKVMTELQLDSLRWVCFPLCLSSCLQVDEVIKAGCEALELRMSEKVNRVSELKFKINSLEKR